MKTSNDVPSSYHVTYPCYINFGEHKKLLSYMVVARNIPKAPVSLMKIDRHMENS